MFPVIRDRHTHTIIWIINFYSVPFSQWPIICRSRENEKKILWNVFCSQSSSSCAIQSTHNGKLGSEPIFFSFGHFMTSIFPLWVCCCCCFFFPLMQQLVLNYLGSRSNWRKIELSISFKACIKCNSLEIQQVCIVKMKCCACLTNYKLDSGVCMCGNVARTSRKPSKSTQLFQIVC